MYKNVQLEKGNQRECKPRSAECFLLERVPHQMMRPVLRKAVQLCTDLLPVVLSQHLTPAVSDGRIIY